MIKIIKDNIKDLLPSKKCIDCVTRLHSSRMHTTRSLTVSPSMLCSRGVPGLGVWSWGHQALNSCIVESIVEDIMDELYDGNMIDELLVPGPGDAWSCGVPGLGGCLVLGGAWSWGCGISACTEADPPVNRITDACENITLPQLHCRR